MPREYEDYRDTLAQLNVSYPSRELLTVLDVMEVTGYSRRTVYRRYPIVRGRIRKTALAREMCQDKK